MKTNTVKQFGRFRTYRLRPLNANNTISAISQWDRNVCATDVEKYLQCPARYLQWKEADAMREPSVAEQVGHVVHEQSAAPEQSRLTGLDLASCVTASIDTKSRKLVVEEVSRLIQLSSAAQRNDSHGAQASKKEAKMLWFDSETNTNWFAKVDSADLKSTERKPYLSIIEQKAGRYRSSMHLQSVFIQAYVSKMSMEFGHLDRIRYAVRYLRDRSGNILCKPDEQFAWLGNHLTNSQKQLLQDYRATLRLMEENWKTGEFRTNAGSFCKTCQFDKTCPAGPKRQAEQDNQAARLEQASTSRKIRCNP